MRRGYGADSSRLLWMVAAVAVTVAAAVIAGSFIWRSSDPEEPTSRSKIEARALIAAAKRDFGLPYNDDYIANGAADTASTDSRFGEVDFSKTKELAERVRILAKELRFSGGYSRGELERIKYALQDAESALKNARSSREGRRAVVEFLDVLEDI